MNRAAGLFLIVLVVAGCGGSRPAPEATPADQVSIALEMLNASATEEGRLDLADRRFGLTIDDTQWAPLLDALEATGRLSDPQTEGSEPLDQGPDHTEFIVDFDVAVSEVGRGAVSVRLHREDESWRIVWFQGPGFEWPSPGRPPDDGLSSSAPPDAME
ncbi:MAG: hypothetical protein OEV00_04015 [Acidobacteriota bacterium]|nr:hypothetical protein [Acidobacteriota bacterium]MDH3784478.1 hypothetical protein [Acidobacteriota bacterium]